LLYQTPLLSRSQKLPCSLYFLAVQQQIVQIHAGNQTLSLAARLRRRAASDVLFTSGGINNKIYPHVDTRHLRSQLAKRQPSLAGLRDTLVLPQCSHLTNRNHEHIIGLPENSYLRQPASAVDIELDSASV